MPTTAFAEGGSNITGTGLVDDPYLIYTAEGLKAFRNKVDGGESGAHAKMMADIVLNDGTFDENGNYTKGESGKDAEKWTPIGSYAGTFDGQGHTVKGLYAVANDNNGACSALFGKVSGGTVKNLAVTGYVSGSANNSDNSWSFVGGIAARAETDDVTRINSTIEGCVNLCHVAAPTEYSVIGGIVGSVAGSSAIKNCANLGEISGKVSASKNPTVGGITGQTTKGCKIISCYNVGRVANGCGIAATDNYPQVTNSCYLTGTADTAIINTIKDIAETRKTKEEFADGTVRSGGHRRGCSCR